MYDIVIAGSGLGGLVCGYILSKEGYSVCIVEKHHQLGGCLQTFERKGCVFDTGMHYVGSLDEGQILWRFFKYFDLLGKVKLKRLDMDCFDLIHIAGEDYKYAQGYDNFIQTLLQYFPHEKAALTAYVNKLKKIRKSLSNVTNNVNSGDPIGSMKYFSMNTYEFIKSVSANSKLQNVLAGLNSLHAGRPETNPLYQHAIINNSLIESAWRFVDGGSQIATYLAESIESNGGVILKNAEVIRFVMDANDQQLEYIELANKEQIRAKYFISNIHPVRTFEMLQSKLIRKAFIHRLNSIEQTVSVFSLYIVFKENTFPYLNYNYHHYNSPNAWGMQIYDEVKWPDGCMLYTPATSKSDTYANCMNVMTYLKYEELRKWENTVVEHRGEEYREYKHQKAELLLDLIEKKFPSIRNQIKTYYTSTPLTYRDYTGTVNGSIYGIMKDSTNLAKTFISQKTKIPNLYLTGQNISLHGVIGVSVGAIRTCSQFVGAQYLYDKINNA